MKVTRRMLKDYGKNKREIPILEMELEELKTSAVNLGNVFDYRTGYPKSQSIVGIDEKLYMQRKKVLDQKKEEVKTVEVWIEAIPDGQTRIVFKDKYINEMSWSRIAKKIGFKSNIDYPRLHIRDKYLKEMKIK